ncbi:MAG: hypothetical protein GY820_29640 [Gammaproteobacteria bacterium]|nr:hypothetical protein [Gammaproteobacteria bacterium]
MSTRDSRYARAARFNSRLSLRSRRSLQSRMLRCARIIATRFRRSARPFGCRKTWYSPLRVSAKTSGACGASAFASASRGLRMPEMVILAPKPLLHGNFERLVSDTMGICCLQHSTQL